MTESPNIVNLLQFNASGSNGTEPNEDGYTSLVEYNIGMIIEANPDVRDWRLCWGRIWGTWPFLRIGPLTLLGPGNYDKMSNTAAVRTCIIGRECRMLVTMTRGGEHNTMKLLYPGYSCFDPRPEALVTAKFLTNPVAVDPDGLE